MPRTENVYAMVERRSNGKRRTREALEGELRRIRCQVRRAIRQGGVPLETTVARIAVLEGLIENYDRPKLTVPSVTSRSHRALV